MESMKKVSKKAALIAALMAKKASASVVRGHCSGGGHCVVGL